MKQLLLSLAIAISFSVNAQNIDTIYVRNLQLKYEEWSWIVSGINPVSLDSINKKRYKKLLKALDNANPSGFSTNIVYDSLPGRFAMYAFREYWTTHSARENMGTGIDSKLRAYTPLLPFILAADSTRKTDFINRRNNGRDAIE